MADVSTEGAAAVAAQAAIEMNQKVLEENGQGGKGALKSVHKDVEGTTVIAGDKETAQQFKKGAHDELNEIIKKLGNNAKDSVQMLGTGDFLVKDEGRQTLFMPNGDKLTIRPDGSYDLKATGAVRVSSRDGRTTLSYPSGDQVAFDEEGILSVSRGDQTVSFARKVWDGQSNSGHGGSNKPNESPNRYPQQGPMDKNEMPSPKKKLP